MIARSNRVVPLADDGLGGRGVRSRTFRFDSPAIAPALQIVGALRQSRRFSSFSRRLCCERAVAIAVDFFWPASDQSTLHMQWLLDI
jgi:hypothetical protein